jgi:hypothetical protein
MSPGFRLTKGLPSHLCIYSMMVFCLKVISESVIGPKPKIHSKRPSTRFAIIRSNYPMEVPASLQRPAKQLRCGRFRHYFLILLPILSALCTSLMIWKGLSVLSASSVPIVSVISESMAPAFHRGDLLFLSNRSSHVQAGDIPVVWFSGRNLPMVHRAIRVYHGDEDDRDSQPR